MKNTFILKKSKKGNYYFRNEEGKIIMVNENIAKIWDDIDDITVGEYEITKDADGNDLEQPVTAYEVVGYSSEVKDLTKANKIGKLRIENELGLEALKLKLQAEIKGLK